MCVMHTALDVLAWRWLRVKNTARPSPNTQRARSDDLEGIAARLTQHLGRDSTVTALSALEPTDLTVDHLREAFADYADSHSPASIRRAMSTWRGFCKWLWSDQNLLPENPIDRLEGPRATPWRPKPLSEDDLARVIIAAHVPSPTARNPWPELERALCACLVTTGVRVSELITLRVGDIHRSPTEHARLHVSGKGSRGRTVVMPPEALPILDSYLESRAVHLKAPRAQDLLFVRRDGTPLTRRALDHVVLGWFRRAGVNPPRGALAHSLRHTYATLLVDNGGTLPEVQRLLGHAHLATTQAYLDVTAHGVEATALANPARSLLQASDRPSRRN